ncbi:hypothetical protein C823_000256 [Eubacterium plexicaudatum ASF492]|nr:hypothetical protein C823_000256 [Eubacterium plexicaudatum ASF492]
MDLFIFSDESGVFDKAHNEIFVYGGLIFIGKQQKDEYIRRYLTAEKTIRAEKYSNGSELKACRITNKEKGKLYRSLGGAIKFGVIVNQKMLLREGLEQEFKLGTYNMQYEKFFPPLFETMKGIRLEFCDSKKVTLIRAADIVANRIYFMALNRKLENLSGIYISSLP